MEKKLNQLTTTTTTTNIQSLRLHGNPMVIDQNAAAYIAYNHHHHFNTVRAARLKSIHGHQNQHLHSMIQRQQPPASSSSTLNGLFTWKRKLKTNKTIGNNGTGTVSGDRTLIARHTNYRHAQHVVSTVPNTSSSRSMATVPPSLARLFVRDAGSPQRSSSSSHPSDSMCVCRGLTGSTFMAPSYFDDDDSQLIAPSKGKHSSVLSMSNDSLLVANSNQQLTNTKHHPTSVAMGKHFHTINERRLTNASKSLDRIASQSSVSQNKQSNQSINQSIGHSGSNNRRSILECNVNPYELVMTNGSNHEPDVSSTAKLSKRNKPKWKSTTVTVKSSHPMWANHTINNNHKTTNMFDACLDCKDKKSTNRLIRNLFSKANSIRIAGQTVYSAIQFADCPHRQLSGLFDQETNLQHLLPTNPLHRTRSSGSLSSSWSFDSNSQSNSDSSLNRTSNASRQRHDVDQRILTLIDEPEPDYDVEDNNSHVCHVEHTDQQLKNSNDIKVDLPRKKSPTNSIKRPKNTPPPPPPPPPPELFSTPLPKLTNCPPFKNESENQQSNIKSSKSNSQEGKSYQNELKERLNQGVKSILKKTNFYSQHSSSLNEMVLAVAVDDNSETDDVSFKEKKHVHFRMKRTSPSSTVGSVGLNRSRSASHIITETIHEEDDEHGGYYDDVSHSPDIDDLPLLTTRSVDDMTDFGEKNSTDFANGKYIHL